MANTSLQQQLQRLSVKQVKHSLTEIRTRPSFLYEPKDAAGISQDALYYAALDAFDDLATRSKGSLREVLNTASPLFNRQSLELNRLMVSQEENAKIDQKIRLLLLRLSPFFTFSSCHIILEWLIARFQINWFNVDDVMACIFPYHHHNYFVRMVQICDTSNWSWLEDLKKDGVPLSNSAVQRRLMVDQEFFIFACNLAFDSSEAHSRTDSSCIGVALAHNAICFFLKAMICSIQQSEGPLKLWVAPLLVNRIKRGLRSVCAELQEACVMICAVFAKCHGFNKFTSRMLTALVKDTMTINRLKAIQVLIDSSDLCVLPRRCFDSICETADQFLFTMVPSPSLVRCLLKNCVRTASEQNEDDSNRLEVFEFCLNHCDVHSASVFCRFCIERFSENFKDKSAVSQIIDSLCRRFPDAVADELGRMDKDANETCLTKRRLIAERLFAAKHSLLSEDTSRFIGLNDNSSAVRIECIRQVHEDLKFKRNVDFCIDSLILRLRSDQDPGVLEQAQNACLDGYNLCSPDKKEAISNALAGSIALQCSRTSPLHWSILNDQSLNIVIRSRLLFRLFALSDDADLSEYQNNLAVFCEELSPRVSDMDALFEQVLDKLAHYVVDSSDWLIEQVSAGNAMLAFVLTTRRAMREKVLDTVLALLESPDLIALLYRQSSSLKRRHIASCLPATKSLLSSFRSQDLLSVVHACLVQLLSAIPGWPSPVYPLQRLFAQLSQSSSIDCHSQLIILLYLKAFGSLGSDGVAQFIMGCSSDKSPIGRDPVACLRALQLFRLGISKHIIDTELLNQRIPGLLLTLLQHKDGVIASELLDLLRSLNSSGESPYGPLVDAIICRRNEIVACPQTIPHFVASHVKKDPKVLPKLIDLCRLEPKVALLLCDCRSTNILRLLLNRIPKCERQSLPIIGSLIPHAKMAIKDPALKGKDIYRLLINCLDVPHAIELWDLYSKALRKKLTYRLYRRFLTSAVRKFTALKGLKLGRLKKLLHVPSLKRILVSNQDVQFIGSFLELTFPLYASATKVICLDIFSIIADWRIGSIVNTKSHHEDPTLSCYVDKMIVSFAQSLVRKGTMDATLLCNLFRCFLKSPDSSAVDECLATIANSALISKQPALADVRKCVDSIPRPIALDLGMSKHADSIIETMGHLGLYESLVNNALIGFDCEDEMAKNRFRSIGLFNKVDARRFNVVQHCCFRYACRRKDRGRTMVSFFNQALADICRNFGASQMIHLIESCVTSGGKDSEVRDHKLRFLTGVLNDRPDCLNISNEDERNCVIATTERALLGLTVQDLCLSELVQKLLKSLGDSEIVAVVNRYCSGWPSSASLAATNAIFDHLSSAGYDSNPLSLQFIEQVVSALPTFVDTKKAVPLSILKFCSNVVFNFAGCSDEQVFDSVLCVYIGLASRDDFSDYDALPLVFAVIERIITSSNILHRLNESISALLTRESYFITIPQLRDCFIEMMVSIIGSLKGLLSPLICPLIKTCLAHPDVTLALQQAISRSIPLRVLVQGVTKGFVNDTGTTIPSEREILCSLLHQSTMVSTADDINLSFLQIRKLCMTFLHSMWSDLTCDPDCGSSYQQAHEAANNLFLAIVLKLSEDTFSPFFTDVTNWALEEPTDTDRLTVFLSLCNCLSRGLRSLFTRFAGRVLDVIPTILESIHDCPRLTRSALECLHSLLSHDEEKATNAGDRFNKIHRCLLSQLVSKTIPDALLIADVVCPCFGQLLRAVSSPDCTRQVVLALRDGPSRSNRRADRLNAIEVIRQIAMCLRSDFRYSLPEIVPIVAELMEDKSEKVVDQTNCLISEIENLAGESLQNVFVH